MTRRPRDVDDLYLAPLALDLDEALAGLAGLSQAQLAETVALRTNQDADTEDVRRKLVLEAVTHVVDLRHWQVGWDPRGLAVHHEEHRLVLGVPDNVRQYVGL